MNDLIKLRDQLRMFAQERDWEQFHTPKNLACALSVECAELLEHFQWAGAGSEEPTQSEREQLAEEVADVLIYLIRLADILGIDPIGAAEAKIGKNALKYPVALAKGRSVKSSEL